MTLRLGQLEANRCRDIIRSGGGYPYTPDLWRLEKYRRQLLFVTDEWMSDRHQSFVIKDLPSQPECYGRGFSDERFNFLIKATDPHKTPVLLPDETGHRVMGEVWSITGEDFTKLDKLKMNGVKSLRERVQIIYPYRLHGFVQNYDGMFTPDGHLLPEALQGKKHWIGPERVWILEGWMYFAHPEYWTEMVHMNPFFFDRVPIFQPKKEKTWLEEYYRYQNP